MLKLHYPTELKSSLPKGIIRVTDNEDKLVCLVDGTIPKYYNEAFVEAMENKIVKKSLIGK